MSQDSQRIVVVGAGVFGTATALALRARGHQVTLVDRGAIPHVEASSTDISKMIRMDYGSDVFYHEFAEQALDGWDRWNADWPRPLYHPDGFLVLSREPMAPGGFEFESFRMLEKRGYAPERIDSTMFAARYPAWNAEYHVDGYLSPRGGWAESGAVVRRLGELGDRAGVTFVQGTVTGLSSHGSRVRGVSVAPIGRTLSEEITAETVILCVGAWLPRVLPSLEPVLTTVAQPVLHFGVGDSDRYRGTHFPPFAADIAGSGWYGFPAVADGTLKLGHHGPGTTVTPDRRGTVDDAHQARARAFLTAAIPSLAQAPLTHRRVCLYCDSFDGDLLIDRDPARMGLVVAGGGSGHGFKFAPLIGGLVADVVEDRPNRWQHRFRWRSVERRTTEQARMNETTDSGGVRP